MPNFNGSLAKPSLNLVHHITVPYLDVITYACTNPYASSAMAVNIISHCWFDNFRSDMGAFIPVSIPVEVYGM